MTGNVINLQTQVTDTVKQPRKKPIGGEEHIFYRSEICILSAKDLDVLGPMQWAISLDNSPDSVLEGIYQRIESEEMQAILKSPDPTVRAKAVCALSLTYEILSNAGYKEFLPHHKRLQVGFYRLAMTSKKILTRKMFDPATSDEEADQISNFLVDMSSHPGWKRGDVGSGNA
jgi:hypothetical protein